MPAAPAPDSNFADTLIEVWRQSLLDKSDAVTLGAQSYPVTTSKKKRLRQVDFSFDGNSIVGIQQNPETKSDWAKMARTGKKSDAVYTRGPLRRRRGRWQSNVLRQTSRHINYRRHK